MYLDFAEAIGRLGKDVVQERYGNLFEMYERIAGEDPYDDADAHLPGHRTTRWAGCGSTTS